MHRTGQSDPPARPPFSRPFPLPRYLDVLERNLLVAQAEPARRRSQVDVYLGHPDGQHAHHVLGHEVGGVEIDEGGQEEQDGDMDLRRAGGPVEARPGQASPGIGASGSNIPP